VRACVKLCFYYKCVCVNAHTASGSTFAVTSNIGELAHVFMILKFFADSICDFDCFVITVSVLLAKCFLHQTFRRNENNYHNSGHYPTSWLLFKT
jgi:hypothetical protein